MDTSRRMNISSNSTESRSPPTRVTNWLAVFCLFSMPIQKPSLRRHVLAVWPVLCSAPVSLHITAEIPDHNILHRRGHLLQSIFHDHPRGRIAKDDIWQLAFISISAQSHWARGDVEEDVVSPIPIWIFLSSELKHLGELLTISASNTCIVFLCSS